MHNNVGGRDVSDQMEDLSATRVTKGKIKKTTKLKKWFVTKMCEFSRGRQLIRKLTGNMGVDVLDALQVILLKHSGKARADEIVLHLYKGLPV